VLHEIEVRGIGRVELPAYGVADAEHRVEKEIRALLSDSRVEILRVERPVNSDRIVEEFTVGYRIVRQTKVEADTQEKARSAAFRESRARLAGSRYLRTEWSAPAGSPSQVRKDDH
jgi:hypothetical protein